uniref:Uncharacterized protein n=1 Tax=Cyanistes caeruleus TaxID=156563 RepID=A0A8C0U9R5_CYACU
MSDGILSKAATMEIPISSNGDTSSLPEDDGLEQDLQQVMVSGPNLNETSIVSGGYGGTAEGIIPTGTIKGRHPHGCLSPSCGGGSQVCPSPSAAGALECAVDEGAGRGPQAHTLLAFSCCPSQTRPQQGWLGSAAWETWHRCSCSVQISP